MNRFLTKIPLLAVHKCFLLVVFLLFHNFGWGQNWELTFQVDMSAETIHPNGVHVAGTFQAPAGFPDNWDPSTTQLLDQDGDQIYEVTVEVPPGYYLYKFINGNNWGHKPETQSGYCAVSDGGGNFNRSITVGQTNLTLPVTPFDSCLAQLHLQVNMDGQNVSPAGLHVMGDFQEASGYDANWSPNTIPMVDLNGNGVYEATVQLPAGAYQYQFVNGDQVADAEIVPATCGTAGPGGTLVRMAEVMSGANEAGPYCFSTCDLCDPSLNTNYETYWWNEAVFYEIFVRSFKDSDGDGKGDFAGLIEKLDYLNDGNPETDTDLGITGIWLMPMMESPSYHGYDVTDYFATEPDYGTMSEFQAFLDAAHDRGIKVIIDFVTNHCSSQHPWFTQAAAGQNGYKDWFIWRDNHPGYNGPWGQPVWHSSGNEYFYGLFWSGMPDLNYDHPPVKEALFQAAEFWLNTGVDGFRLDAIKYLDEDFPILENTPQTFALLEEFTQVYHGVNPDAFTVGEVWSNTNSIIPYVQNDRLDVCFEFDLSYNILSAVNSGNPDNLKNHMAYVEQVYPRLQYATFLTNHDIDRVYSQLGGQSGKMKLAAATYLTLPGIPFIYYGEELGMYGTGDHVNIRRPMQWTGATGGGFTTGNPWTGLGADYQANNVEDMQADPNSLLSHYQKLVHLRNAHPALQTGYFLPLESSNNSILAFARIKEEEGLLVVANFGTGAANPVLDLPVSTLASGTFYATDLYSGTALGLLEVGENGEIMNWQSTALLNGQSTWVIQLSEDEPVNSVHSRPRKNTWDISVFPTPSADWVQIDAGEPGQPIYYELLDRSGGLLEQGSFVQSHTLEISHLAAGSYFLKVRRGDQVRIKRLLKVD